MSEREKTGTSAVNELEHLRRENDELRACLALSQEKAEDHATIRQLAIVSETVLELERCNESQRIFDILCEKIHDLAADSAVLVSALDGDGKSVRIVASRGFEQVKEQVLGLLGVNPADFRFPLGDIVSDRELRALTSHHLEEVYRIEGLVRGQIPKTTCRAIEKLLGTKRVFRVGFVVDERPFGSVSILSRSEAPLEFRETIEILVNQASLVLHRRRAEEQLRESEKKYRLLAEHAHDLIYHIRLEPSFIYEYVSPSCTGITGYSPDDYYDDPTLVARVVHPDDLHLLTDMIRDRVITGRPVCMRWIHRDGTMIWMELRNTPVVDASGRVVAIEGVARDISERKHAEDGLRTSEEKYRILLEESEDPTFSFNVDGTYRYVNRAFASPMGKTPEDIIGRHIEEVFDPDEAAKRRVVLDEVLRTGIKKVFEVRVPTAAGDRFYVTSVTPVRDSSGAVDSAICSSKEITDRKRAEDALQAMADMLDTAPSSITVHTFEGVFLYANRKTFEIHGYTPDEFMALNLRQIDIPESEKKIGERIAAINEHGEAVFEVTHFRKDGSTVPLELYVKKVIWAGKPAMLSIATDITNRKKAADELRESNQRHSTLFETMTQGVVYHNATGAITAINAAAEDFLGVTWEQATGLTPMDPRWRIIHADGSPYPGDTHPSALALMTGRPVIDAIMGVFNPRENRIRWGRVSAVPQFNPGEKRPCQVNVTIEDITVLKAVEEALRESEEKLRLIVECIPGVVYLARNDTNYTPLFLSERCREVFGCPREALLSGELTFPDIYHPDDWPNVVRSIDDALAEKRSYIMDSRLRHPGGVLIWGREIGQGYFAPNGDLQYLVGLVIDVTDQRERDERNRKLEEQLYQAQKMESVGRLAGGIAHDFNNLLTAIMGNVELAMMTVRPGERVYRDLTEVRKSAERAANLTRQLLAFSRRQIIEPRVLILNDILADMEKMLDRLIGEDIELVSIFSTGLWQVKIDPSQVEQVVTNLVVNSRDALPDGGTITLETRNVAIEENHDHEQTDMRPGRYVLLAVTDDGTGMDEETKQRLFEPFFTTKERGKGTGLGLSTCYGIVKQNEGFIAVYSEPGHGTIVKVYLPAAFEEAAVIIAPREEVTRPTGNETVLVAEDEPGVRNMIARVLADAGFAVITAANGEEALMRARAFPAVIHLLVTDVVMPHMGGKELVEHLTSDRHGLKVLYMSGYTDNSIVHHGVLDKGIAFMQKPFSPTAIVSKVRQVLDGV